MCFKINLTTNFKFHTWWQPYAWHRFRGVSPFPGSRPEKKRGQKIANLKTPFFTKKFNFVLPELKKWNLFHENACCMTCPDVTLFVFHLLFEKNAFQFCVSMLVLNISNVFLTVVTLCFVKIFSARGYCKMRNRPYLWTGLFMRFSLRFFKYDSSL